MTNQRDNAFKTTIENDYPDIEIVAEQGIADPARAEEIANALLLKNPDLDGIYVTWAEPAEGVLAALRAAGNTDTKIVTLDLSEPVALDMVQGGNVAAIVADQAYELGRAMATVGRLRPARQGSAALRRGAGDDRDQGECRGGLSGLAAPRRAAERGRREQVAHADRSQFNSGRRLTQAPVRSHSGGLDDNSTDHSNVVGAALAASPGARRVSWLRGEHDRPERRERNARRDRHAHAGGGSEDQGGQAYRRARLAHLVGLHDRGRPGRQGRVRPPRHRGGRRRPTRSSIRPSRRATSRRSWPRSRASSCRCRSIPTRPPRSTGRRSRPAPCSASSTTRRRASSRARTT